MAQGLTFDIRGYDDLRKALDKKIESLTADIDAELSASAITMNEKQIAYTPVDTGRLRGANNVDISKPLEKTLSNNVEYAPYIEFGTGGLVTIPPGLEDIAGQFKGAGIRKINRRAQPFFFRAFFEEKGEMIKRLRKLLAK